MHTKEQFVAMERFEFGRVWRWHQNQKEDEIIRYLMDEGVIQARVDKRKDLLQLTQKGRVLLDAHRNECAKTKKEEAEQKAREATRLKERAEDRATEERRHQEQKSTAIKTAFLSAGLSFIAGVLAEHFFQITEYFANLFVHL